MITMMMMMTMIIVIMATIVAMVTMIVVMMMIMTMIIVTMTEIIMMMIMTVVIAIKGGREESNTAGPPGEDGENEGRAGGGIGREAEVGRELSTAIRRGLSMKFNFHAGCDGHAPCDITIAWYNYIYMYIINNILIIISVIMIIILYRRYLNKVTWFI